MPRFRPDLDSIPTYHPGRPLSEVARELGLETITDLGSNEDPREPFPEVRAAITEAVSGVNRYPLTDSPYLADALAEHHGVDPDWVWVAPGSTGMLIATAIAASGPGSSVVFADPSFVVYRMAATIAGATPLAVPVDAEWRLDAAAMAAAVRDDTNLIYYCNPNNPTGTHTSFSAMEQLAKAVPPEVTIVFDEAYAEYVTAPDWSPAIPLTARHENVVVSRTFSKVYGLAGERVGYAIGNPGLLGALSRPQPPYAVSTLAQVAALAALGQQERVVERVAETVAGREWIARLLRDLGQFAIDSQTNFVLWRPSDSRTAADAVLRRGTLVRALGPWVRITVGTPEQNRRCLDAIEQGLAAGLF
ncbi:MAG: histidinol-phosphate transaminase [Actinomycetota bacterium]|nr:histidinol-phosphate transaminase [Actinomycetota bacterium]